MSDSVSARMKFNFNENIKSCGDSIDDDLCDEESLENLTREQRITISNIVDSQLNRHFADLEIDLFGEV